MSVTTIPAQGRALAQRERILEAAEACFIDHGFHTATMADIAQRSGISAGLIYRYFDNKQAVILASIERHLGRNRDQIERLDPGLDLVAGLGTAFASWREGATPSWHVALLCEAVAESGRDPQVAAAIRHFFRDARQALAEWIQRRDDGESAAGPACDSSQSRALLLQCLIEGLLIRAHCEPDLDGRLLADMLQQVAGLLSAAGGPAPRPGTRDD